jgi:hypothetical protein
MPNMKGMGPGCCCCIHTIGGNEQYYWATELNSAGTNIEVRAKPDDPTDPRESVTRLDFPFTGDKLGGTMTPDWKNKRICYTWVQRIRSGGGAEIGMNTHFKTWDAKTFGVGDVIGTAITTLTDFIVDSLACDPDNEHIYFTGYQYPRPDFGTTGPDANVEFRRMDYDGTNQTTLDTPQIFRDTPTLTLPPGVGSMLIQRDQQRLYYVKRQNVTSATAPESVLEVCYRDLATFTENVIYSVPCFSTLSASSAIRLINCLSFDIARGKIYFVEHYRNGGGQQQSNVLRANLDGTGLETLYNSADPYYVNFARYSNKLDKILHEDFDRVGTQPRDGFYIRETDFTLIEQIGRIDTGEVISAAAPCSSYLWCGYEGNTA